MTCQSTRGQPRPGAAAPMLPRPPAWMSHGLCTRADPDAWFPEKGHKDLARAATRVCARCPVRRLCLAYALANREQHGIWGGTTPRQRRALLAGQEGAA